MRNGEVELGRIGNFGFPPAVFGNGADGLESLDVERRIGRWWNGEDAFPEIVKLEKELDFCFLGDRSNVFHLRPATRAGGGIASPDPFDEGFPIGFLSVFLFGRWFWKNE